ncbi:MAG: phage portal protein [Oscillospiraceae bacterium]|nr:phage portal protein [Oscillospiraceae bacterium]
MQRSLAETGVARSYSTVFELPGMPVFRQFYEIGIFVWKWLYRGLYTPWHVVPAPTIKDPNARRELYRLNAAKAVCSEMAGMVWGEECAASVSIDGRESTDENPDPLNEWLQMVLVKNAFGEKMQELIEQALALGGAAIKVWHEERRDSDGNVVPGSGAIRLGYSMADQFVPLAWDNARVTEGVFISRRAKNGYYYTRLEWHRWNGETYVISNELFRSEMQRGAAAGSNQDILGVRWPLEDLYPYLDAETVVPVGESLFSYFRTPIANNLDDNSPLGVSIYANALETLHALDICYDSFVREFRLGKKRIIVPARAVRTVIDPTSGQVRRYFDPCDETYEALASDDPNDLKITDNSVELRVEEHVQALNAFLSILCLQVGFSAGTFSFDERGGMKTATEVVSENSKTYKTIRTVQTQLRPAIEHMIRNIIDVAVLYGVEYGGQTIESMIRGGYHVNVAFDDGVTQDRQTNINEGVMLVGAGLLSKYTFLTDRKYGQGLTPEEAEAELKRIAAEGNVSAQAVDFFGAYNGG